MSKVIGQFFEAKSKAYLIREGYQILEQNWRYRKSEIDLIAKHNSELVFVEVKQRRSTFFGSPAAFVSKAQQKRIIEAANAYILKINWQYEVRFDVIAITGSQEQHSLEHINTAFRPC